MALSVGTLCITAQPGPHKKEMAGDHKMAMSKEPHHMLAMAYHQNVVTFAKSLAKQANDGPLNVEFARTAVKEMRRGFDEMQLHHDAHMKTMPAGMPTKMEGMMRKMETHRTEMKNSLTALEVEIGMATPDAKKVSALAVSVGTHCEAMMNQGGMAKT